MKRLTLIAAIMLILTGCGTKTADGSDDKTSVV